MKKKFLLKTIFLLFIAASMVPMAMPAQAVTLAGQLTGTLRVNAGSPPEIIDPQKASFVSEIGHAKLIYEGLTRLDSELETVPAAAKSWDFSADGKEITFLLNTGLKYSDGSLLNAKRFQFSILRTMDPTVAGEYASMLDAIVGAEQYRTADPATHTSQQLAALRAAVEVWALDTNNSPCTSYAQASCLKLKIKLVRPVYHFPTIMSLWVVYPAKEELIAAGGAQWWLNTKNLVGNGPFAVNTLDYIEGSLFTPNFFYWRGAPNYRVKYLYYYDSTVAFQDYKNGKLDITPLWAGDLAEVKTNPALNSALKFYAGSCTFAVMFDNAKPPFNDPKVRAAFSYAFDRDAWAHDILGDVGLPTLNWIPKGMPGYQPETRWGFDPTKANQALADSTYHSAAALPPITVQFTNTPRNNQRWNWLRDHWQSVLGVSIDLQPVEYLTETDIWILGWCADYPDPSNYLSDYWKTGSFASRINYSNPALDALLDQADGTADPTTRMTLYAQAQDMLVGDVPVAFGWNSGNLYLVRSNVVGEVETTLDSLWPGEIDPLTISLNNNLKFNFIPLFNK